MSARKMKQALAEILVATAAIAGWLAFSSAIAQIAPPGIVWRASVGFLLLSLCGWKFLYTLAREGLYALTRERS